MSGGSSSHPYSNMVRSFLEITLGSNVAREGPCFFKATEKEGLQGGKYDKNEVGQPQHIHDPGIQQEPQQIYTIYQRYSDTTDGKVQWCPLEELLRNNINALFLVRFHH
jgi:hypothetical protein